MILCRSVQMMLKNSIISKLLILLTMFESLEPVHFVDIVEKLKTIYAQERLVINNVITIKKQCYTTGSTIAKTESSFSLARQVKTWP